MPSRGDCKFDKSELLACEDLEDGATAGFRDRITEKGGLLSPNERGTAAHRRYLPFGCIAKLLYAVILASCVALVLMLNDCLPSKGLPRENPDSSTIRLVKDAVSATTAGVTEDFQVYQPVFTPSGATDETTLSNGSENTTTIAQTNATGSCQVLLMQHTFAFSYGIPFVG